jgi:hypothetical protein
MQCSARAQGGTNLCKTHSKTRSVAAVAPPVVELSSVLTSSLEPGVVFGSRNENGTVSFSARSDSPDDLF